MPVKNGRWLTIYINVVPLIIVTGIIPVTSALASNAMSSPAISTTKVVRADEIKWGHLNPLRGDKAPAAAELWGDRTQNTATGMLVKFNKGFSSPAHIHNITYKGIVLEGLMHNDDPDAKTMWMPTGSFWTQPAGEDHITAAQGETNLIYLEIETGPYLVKSSKQAFNNGEHPINQHYDNLVWLNANEVSFINPDNNVSVASLWGNYNTGQLRGTLVKLPAGFNGQIHVDTQEFRAVIIKGQASYASAEHIQTTMLTTGSYVYSTGAVTHKFANSAETVIYIRTNGRFYVE